ncbi:MAG: hypothetical protein HKL90_10875 [Elusimicrobia bacterium]|nr:hypothetical protein [Elusimicrobiota bacterium]
MDTRYAAPPVFKLDIGAKQGNVVTFKPLTSGDFAGGPTTPPVKPVPNPHGHGGGPTADALTAAETNWLALDQFEHYRNLHWKILHEKLAPKTRNLRLAELFNRTRAEIELNLPPASAGQYKDALGKGRTENLERIAAKAAYAASDIALTGDEQARLGKMPSSTGPGKTLLEDYNAEIVLDGKQVDQGESAEPVKLRDAAAIITDRKNILYFRTTTDYRRRAGAGPAAGGTVDPTLGLPDALQPYLKAQWPDYQKRRDADEKTIAANANPGDVQRAREDLDKANESALQGIRAQQKTLTKNDVGAIHSALSGAWGKFWNQLCLPYGSSSGSGATTSSGCQSPDVILEMLKKCKIPTSTSTSGAQTTQTGGMSAECVAAQRCQNLSPKTTPAPAPTFQADRNTQLGVACIPGNAPSADPSSGGTPTVPPVPTPGSQTPAVNDGNVGDVGVGTTSSNTSTPNKDTHMMAHVMSGVGGAMVGLLFGVLFGPVGVLVGGALGFAAGFAADKYLPGGTGNSSSW